MQSPQHLIVKTHLHVHWASKFQFKGTKCVQHFFCVRADMYTQCCNKYYKISNQCYNINGINGALAIKQYT